LIQVFRSVSGLGRKYSLVIVGDGSLRDFVAKIVQQNDSIHALGRLSGDSVYQVLSACDVLVLPSHFEPWGLVVNEAMAAGLPVIVSDRVGASEDLVVDGETGLIVKSGDREALQRAIITMGADAVMRQQMAMAAREHISGWTLENEAKNVVKAWEIACSG